MGWLRYARTLLLLIHINAHCRHLPIGIRRSIDINNMKLTEWPKSNVRRKDLSMSVVFHTSLSTSSFLLAAKRPAGVRPEDAPVQSQLRP